MSPSLTVLLPAYNEQDNIAQAIDNVKRAMEGLVTDHEIIVIDDGSQDNTSLIAQERARQDPRVYCVRNDQNRGYGFSFARGVKLARKDHIGSYTSDNDMSWESFRDMVKLIGKADIISSYVGNRHHPQWLRRVLSRMFVILLNTSFNLRLKYYNGHFICRREILQALTITSSGLTVPAECKVRLIKQGCSYVEVPIIHVPRSSGKSSALRLKSIAAVIADLRLLYRDVFFKAR